LGTGLTKVTWKS